MKKEIKKIITIIKAAPQLKTRIITALSFLIAGICFEITAKTLSTYNILGLFYLSNVTGQIYQTIMSVSCTGLGQTSSSAKKLQISFPFYIKLLVNSILFFIVSFNSVYIASKPALDMSIKESISLQCFYILMFSTICFLSSIYEILSHKFFGPSLVGMILFSFIFVTMITYSIVHPQSFFNITNLTFPIAITLGFLILIAGSLLSTLLANLLYKYPISAHVMRVNNKT